MGLSRRHLDTNDRSYPVPFEKLAETLKDRLPDVSFAYLHGSAADDLTVKPHSDCDIAFYLTEKADLKFHRTIEEICTALVGPVRFDIGILNNAEPVFRFEVLKGKLLFARDEELWLRFYSLTCREYETQIVHYEKQLRYRKEAKSEV